MIGLLKDQGSTSIFFCCLQTALTLVRLALVITSSVVAMSQMVAVAVQTQARLIFLVFNFQIQRHVHYHNFGHHNSLLYCLQTAYIRPPPVRVGYVLVKELLPTKALVLHLQASLSF